VPFAETSYLEVLSKKLGDIERHRFHKLSKYSFYSGSINDPVTWTTKYYITVDKKNNTVSAGDHLSILTTTSVTFRSGCIFERGR